MYIRLGLAAAVLVGVPGLMMIDRAANYTQVPARIEGLKASCHFEKSTFYIVGRRREWTRDADCALVEAVKNDPRFSRMNLVRDTTVSVRYFSPVDQQVHTSSYSVRTTGSERPALTVGGVVQILAHTSRPDRIQKL